MRSISIYNISTGFSRFVKSVSSEKEARDFCKLRNSSNSIDYMWLYDD